MIGQAEELHDDVVVYELRGTYKHPSTVDHILLDVDGTTFDPVRARWFYRNVPVSDSHFAH